MTIRNINIQQVLDNFNLLKEQGYKYVDMDISEDVSDPTKYSKALNFTVSDKPEIYIPDPNKPNRKLTIEELIQFES